MKCMKIKEYTGATTVRGRINANIFKYFRIYLLLAVSPMYLGKAEGAGEVMAYIGPWTWPLRLLSGRIRAAKKN